jgi:hypothetical protein
MNVRPMLEELEERATPSAADLALFQQQVPALEARFQGIVQSVQSTLQANLNGLESLATSFPAASQPLHNAVFAQEQQLINAFPAIADVRFQQMLVHIEGKLLARPDVVAVSPGFFGPGFLIPFGFLGYPGIGLGAGALGGGVGFTSGFTSGTSGFSGGSGSGGGDPAPMLGRGPGVGLFTTTGTMTLPPSGPK